MLDKNYSIFDNSVLEVINYLITALGFELQRSSLHSFVFNVWTQLEELNSIPI